MIELGKTYRTRDGREARIYAVDGGGDQAIHGAIKEPAGWFRATWCASGRWSYEALDCEHDLIEVKPKITRMYWLGHYSNGAPCVSGVCREEVVGAFSTRNRIAITGPHEITFTEGDGL